MLNSKDIASPLLTPDQAKKVICEYPLSACSDFGSSAYYFMKHSLERIRVAGGTSPIEYNLDRFLRWYLQQMKAAIG